MECPNCQQPVERGASFCGNCGHQLNVKVRTTESQALTSVTAETDSETADGSYNTANEHPVADYAVLNGIGNTLVSASLSSAVGGIPTYDVPIVSQQRDHLYAAISVIFGSLALVGALLMPLIGLGLGVIGVVFGSMSRRYLRHGLGMIGLIISSLGIIAALASWTYLLSNANHAAQTNRSTTTATNAASAITANELSTPCYDVRFGGSLNVQNSSGSCDMNAFNGTSIDQSSVAYKIYASEAVVSTSGFQSLAKNALENDVRQSLPAFHIISEGVTSFSGSPAYEVLTTNGQGVSLLEAAILHPSTSTTNIYIIVHATSEGIASLEVLQTGWQWK